MSSSVAGTARQMLKSQVTQPELTYCAISIALNEVFSGAELIKIAQEISNVTDLKHTRPMEDYSTNEIRVLLLDHVRDLYEKQPEMLTIVESIIETTATNAPDNS
jgi:hypothetical protein